MRLSLGLDLTGIRVVRTDAELECIDIDAAFEDAGAELVLLPGGITESALCDAVEEACLLLMCYTPITARVISSAPQLRGIVKYGVGIDAIDISAATSQDIPVVNVPEYAETTVAEGAFCLMLALLKRLLPLNAAMQHLGWVHPTQTWLGHDLGGKCVAIVGTGRIGCALARMAGQGFGARVIGYDPNVSRATMTGAGIHKVENLHALLAEADIVSLHTVLNPSTQALIGPNEFAAMQRKPVFINVSRGALVDEQALMAAVDAGQISAAGLDVYAQEPLDRDTHPLAGLFGRDNVILLPHMTFFTHEAMHRLSEDTLARCREILEGRSVTIRSTDPRLIAQADTLDVRLG